MTSVGVYLTNPVYKSWTSVTGCGSTTWQSICVSQDGTVIGLVAQDDSSIGISVSTNSGASFRKFYAGVTDYRSIRGSADCRVMCAVPNTMSTVVYISTDYGNTWNIPAGVNAAVALVNRVSADGSTIVVGSYYSSTIYISTNSGSTWTTSTTVSGNNSYLHGSSDLSTLYLLHVTSNLGVYKSTNTGRSWSLCSNLPSKTWQCVSSSGDGNIVYVCEVAGSGTVYKSTNAGNTWALLTNITSTAWYRCDCSYDGNHVAITSLYDLYISVNAGASWTRISNTAAGGWVTDVVLTQNGNGITICGSGKYIYKNTIFDFPCDIGNLINPYSSGKQVLAGIYTKVEYNNWNTINSVSRSWKSIASSIDGTCLSAVVLNGYIYTSNNSGTTWIEQTNSGSRTWVGIASSSNGQILTACENNGYMWRSTNGGYTWSQQANVQNWTYVACSADATKIYGCENGQYIWRSIDSGINWRAKLSPINWTCVACSSDGTYVSASAFNDYVWLSTNSGYSWVQLTASGSRKWTTIAMSSDGSCISGVTTNDYIYTTNDYGITWIQRTNSGIKNWTGICSSSNGTYLAACANNEYIYTSTDSGQKWLQQKASGIISWTGIACATDGFTAVACGNSNYIYKQVISQAQDIGSMFAPKSYSNPLTMGINCNMPLTGPNWELYLQPVPPLNWTNIKYSANGLYAIAIISGSATPPYISNDSGNTWVSMTNSTLSYTSFTSSVISNNGNIIIFTTTTTNSIYVSTNAGSTWSLRTNVFTLSLTCSTATSDCSIVYLAENNGNLYRSTDYCQTLTKIKTTNNALNFVFTKVSKNGQYVVGVISGSYLYKSDDFGVTWYALTNSGQRYWNAATISNDGQYIVAVDLNAYAYRTTNGGTSWSQSFTAGSAYSVVANSTGSTVYLTTSNGRIYKSVNYGSSWSVAGNSPTAGWGNIEMSNDNSVIMASYVYDVIYLSTNSGSTWKQVYNYGGIIQTLAVNDNGSVIAFTASNGGLYTSTNYGTTWSLKVAQTSVSGLIYDSSLTNAFICDNTNIYSIVFKTDGYVTFNTITSAGNHNWKTLTSTSDFSKIYATYYDSNIYGIMMVSTNLGLTWNKIEIYDNAAPKRWTSIYTVDGTNVLCSETNNGFLYVSNTGDNFTSYSNLGANSWNSICASSDFSKIYACNNNYVYTSSNSGVNWKVNTNYSGTWKNILSNSSGSTVTAIRSTGNVLISTNSGSTWVDITRSNTAAYSSSYDGYNILSCETTNGYIWKSSNSGLTWNQISIKTNPAVSWTGAAASYDGSKMAIATSNGGVYTSTDYGNTWFKSTNTNSLMFSNMRGSSNLSTLIGCRFADYVYTSTNFGLTWKQITMSGSAYWSKACVSQDGTIMAVSGGISGYVYVSTNSGNTWLQTLYSGDWSNGLAMSSDGKYMIAIQSNTQLYTSNDTGNTWVLRTQTGSQNYTGCTMNSSGSVMYYINWWGRIMISTNYGVDWSVLTNSPNGSSVRNISCSGDGRIVVLGVDSGNIYYSVNTGLTWTIPTSVSPANTNPWKSSAVSGDGSYFLMGTTKALYISRPTNTLIDIGNVYEI